MKIYQLSFIDRVLPLLPMLPLLLDIASPAYSPLASLLPLLPPGLRLADMLPRRLPAPASPSGDEIDPRRRLCLPDAAGGGASPAIDALATDVLAASLSDILADEILPVSIIPSVMDALRLALVLLATPNSMTAFSTSSSSFEPPVT